MDEDLARVLEQYRAEMRQHAHEIRQHVEETLGRQVADTRMDLGTLIEGLRDEVHAIAEGHVGLNRQLQELRQENEAAHREILTTIRLTYRDLDRRVTRFESRPESP